MRTKTKAFTFFGSLLVAGVSFQQTFAQGIIEFNSPVAALTAVILEDTFDDLFGEPATDANTTGTDEVPNAKPESKTDSTDQSDPFDVTPSESSTESVEGSTKNAAGAPKESDKTANPESETAKDNTKGSTVTAATPTESKSEQSPAEQSGKIEKSEPVLSPELLRLREQVRDCLGYYYNQQESVVDHSPWGVMHILIAYGVDTEVYASGRKTNAIGYLCFNGQCRGQQLFYVNRGKLETRVGPGVQGHDGQFLAMLAQSRVKMDYPMHVDGRDFTIADLIEYEKRTCEPATELTFKLIGLSHYLDTDVQWKSQTGEDWNIARLIREELAQPIIGAACGGTHRLMGFNYAVRKREKEGKPMTGQWSRARKFLDDYFEYTFYLQNDDGSFSTDFFRGRNSYGDINTRIETTGHILEWFVASLSDKQLQDPRVIKTVDYLTNLMFQNRRNQWEIGPKGHALHALAIYSERVFGDKPGTRDAILARGRKLYVEDQKQR
jgi:hypothetical protein